VVNGNNSCGCGKCSEATWRNISPRRRRGEEWKLCGLWGGGGEEYNVKYHLCTGPSSIFIFVAVKRGLVNGVFKLKCSSMGKTSF